MFDAKVVRDLDEMSLNAADVEAITHALGTVLKTDPPAVHTVVVKLLAFWLTRPAIWFAQVEVQFATRCPPIQADLTKYNMYNYMVAAPWWQP